MTELNQRSKVDFLFVSLCFRNNLLCALYFVQLLGWNRFEFLPFFIHCFCYGYLHCFSPHDLSVEMIPNAFSWTHEPPRYMHALFWESYWIQHSSLQFPEVGSLFARHCCIHWNFQLSRCVLDGFLIFSIFRIDEINASQPSSIIEFWFLVCPFLLLSVERLFQFWSILQAIHDLVW